MTPLLIAAGGALGALARYALGGWVQGWAGPGFPWGTLTVNLLGSLLLGAFLRSLELLAWSPETRALVAVGFFGAFTTFSTFSYEVVALVQRGELGRASVYVLASVGLGVLGLWAGLALASVLLRPSGA